jgi:hypothetical protein
VTLCWPFCSEWCEVDNNAFALELRFDGAVALTTQCCSKSVSTKSLLKTGISRKLAGDFGEILSKVAAFRSLKTATKSTESP